MASCSTWRTSLLFLVWSYLMLTLLCILCLDAVVFESKKPSPDILVGVRLEDCNLSPPTQIESLKFDHWLWMTFAGFSVFLDGGISLLLGQVRWQIQSCVFSLRERACKCQDAPLIAVWTWSYWFGLGCEQGLWSLHTLATLLVSYHEITCYNICHFMYVKLLVLIHLQGQFHCISSVYFSF